MRFSIPEPKVQDYEPPRDYVWQSHEPMPFFTSDGAIELKKPLDQYCAYKFHSIATANHAS
jgi:COMPASS component BRE2